MTSGNKPKRGMVRSLAEGAADLHAIAREHGMSLLEMAEWVERPRHARVLALLEGLLERRTSLLLADARAQAAEALRRMATAETPKETARRACLDLLKISSARDVASRRGVDEDAEPAEEAGAASLNRLMREMDRAASEPRAEASGSGEAADEAG